MRTRIDPQIIQNDFTTRYRRIILLQNDHMIAQTRIFSPFFPQPRLQQFFLHLHFFNSQSQNANETQRHYDHGSQHRYACAIAIAIPARSLFPRTLVAVSPFPERQLSGDGKWRMMIVMRSMLNVIGARRVGADNAASSDCVAQNLTIAQIEIRLNREVFGISVDAFVDFSPNERIG